MFGTIVLNNGRPSEISALDDFGAYKNAAFPFPLLTKRVSATPGTTLAALLESFILCFGRYGRDHSAFDAYKELYRLSENEGDATLHANSVPVLVNSGIEEFIKSGHLSGAQHLDNSRIGLLSAPGEIPDDQAREVRRQNMLAYLNNELNSYEIAQQQDFTGQEMRTIEGACEPSTTIQREILEDLIYANQLLSAYVNGLRV